jgi:hypothetical protein
MPMTPLDLEVMIGPSGVVAIGWASRVGRVRSSFSLEGIESLSLKAVFSSCEGDSEERRMLNCYISAMFNEEIGRGVERA